MKGRVLLWPRQAAAYFDEPHLLESRFLNSSRSVDAWPDKDVQTQWDGGLGLTTRGLAVRRRSSLHALDEATGCAASPR
jgi:hypothetical protein